MSDDPTSSDQASSAVSGSAPAAGTATAVDAAESDPSEPGTDVKATGPTAGDGGDASDAGDNGGTAPADSGTVDAAAGAGSGATSGVGLSASTDVSDATDAGESGQPADTSADAADSGAAADTTDSSGAGDVATGPIDATAPDATAPDATAPDAAAADGGRDAAPSSSSADAGTQPSPGARAAAGTTGRHNGTGYTVYQSTIKLGGTIAWRNNNPGNIRPGGFAQGQGAIGSGGRFAIFPDEVTGMNAIVALLSTADYQALTMRGAIFRYAPPNDNNDSNAYVNAVQRQTGIDPNRQVSSLSDAELHAMAGAIRTIEGWTPGQTLTCADTTAQPWVRAVLGCP
jgi:hypothetical protein